MIDRPRFQLILIATCLIVMSPALIAEDRIIVRTPNGGRIGRACLIVDYTGRGATYQLKSGSGTKRLARQDIVEVTTHYTTAHLAAKQLLDEGAAKEAFQKLNEALEAENRTWVRRQILALQVNCSLWNGDHVTAGERFLAIVESDPDTFYFSQIPLSWSEDPTNAELVRASKRWLMQTDHRTARLLGASHLLTDPEESAAALKALKVLAREDHAEISRLAQFQIWRSRVLADDVSRDELQRWELAIEDGGEDVCGGSRYILGLGWQRRRDDLAGAAAWLWLPYVSCNDRWLAAQATRNAAESLAQAGLTAESQAVWEELSTRYGDTPAGKSVPIR